MEVCSRRCSTNFLHQGKRPVLPLAPQDPWQGSYVGTWKIRLYPTYQFRRNATSLPPRSTDEFSKFLRYLHSQTKSTSSRTHFGVSGAQCHARQLYRRGLDLHDSAGSLCLAVPAVGHARSRSVHRSRADTPLGLSIPNSTRPLCHLTVLSWYSFYCRRKVVMD